MTSKKNNNQAVAWIAAGLAGVCLLLGLTAVVFGWILRSKANAAKSWPSTEATITVSRVVESEYRDQDGYRRIGKGAELVFRYSVNGRTYEGKKLDPTGFSSEDTIAAVGRYPVGARVRAFYDPSNPSDAALTNEASGDARYLFLVIGSIVMLIGAPFGYAAVRLARQSSG